jgi:5-methyltetrahydrofolate--homocysteine methyltransferase
MNPNAARYQDVVNTYKIITGQDAQAQHYINFCQTHPDPYEVVAGRAGAGAGVGSADAGAGTGAGGMNGLPQNAATTATSHIEALPIPPELEASHALVTEVQHYILSGRKDPVAAATETLLETHNPLDIIDGLFIPTLDEVGLRFDAGTFFLPQLMSSAEAVKVGFDVVKAHMGTNEALAEDKPLILATVKGDIHDIGKNIVKMLLENYGYRVIDLGRDVAPQTVLTAVKEEGVGLVGLSALMTTTVKAMEETIALLREEAPDVKTMVGGAVLTPEYAESIGATWYAKDAAESARIAEAYFSGTEYTR